MDFTKGLLIFIGILIGVSIYFVSCNDSFNLNNTSPISKFTVYPEYIDTSSHVQFDGSMSTDSMYTLKYQWDFDDSNGWTDISDEPYIVHRFTVIRDYKVRLKVTDEMGWTDISDTIIRLRSGSVRIWDTINKKSVKDKEY